MATPALVETLASYVPQRVVRRFAVDPTPLTEPTAERFSAAMLFADIVGFTPLAERLAQQGTVGAEELSRLLNSYFGQLIDLIADHGGDIYSFAGDALLALWPTTGAEGHLATATLQAAQCGLAMQAHLHNYAATEAEALQLRLGVGAGDVGELHVGGVDGRWKCLLVGPSLAQLYAAAPQAEPGQVILSPEAWALVQPSCTGHPLATGAVCIDHIHESLPLATLPFPVLLPEMSDALTVYAPRGSLARLEAGQNQWLAELRRVTVLFFHLADLDDANLESLEQVHQALRVVQHVVYQHEGSIVQVLIDDKGCVLKVAFGLSPFAHEDDAVRAIHAAQAVQTQLLQEQGVRSAIGITTGRGFCGTVGNTTRCEYRIVGDVVNLAARLMQHADDEILCDTATMQTTHDRLSFAALPAVHLKGKAETVPLYRPQGLVQRKFLAQGTLIGRTAERQQLTLLLQALHDTSQGGTIVIEGEPGIGKSRLLDDLRLQAETAEISTLLGAGDALDAQTAYHVWRPVFHQLFHLDDLPDDIETRRKHVLAELGGDPTLAQRAPLLNAVLPVDIPDTELTQQMTGEVRADNTQDLLVRLLQRAAQHAPLVLLLEDAHWWDSASWAVARLVSRDSEAALLVVTTRPIPDPVPVAAQPLLESATSQWIHLNALPPEDISTLVCHRLGVEEISEPILDFISEKAEGHPFFSEELTLALREAGLIQIMNGGCQLAPEVTDLRSVAFPDTVQGVVTSRIDRLPPAQQLALKVASVIGRVFAWRTLYAVYPLTADRARLTEYLADLQQADFTLLDTPEPDLAYLFKHVIAQEAAYNLLPFAQRRELHQTIAEWYERTYAHDLAPYYPLLAYHWRQAEGGAKAIEYLAKAGEQAVEQGAYREAVEFLQDALTLDAHQGAERNTELRGHWERLLGEAHYGLGHLVESRTHLEKAASLLGFPVPTTRLGWGGRLGGQVLRLALTRLWPVHHTGHAHNTKPSLLEIVRVYERLGQMYWFAGDSLAMACLITHGGNLAEATGPSLELARYYANMSLGFGCIPIRPLAERYSRKALEMVLTIDDLRTQGWVLELKALYRVGLCQWTEVEDEAGQAAAIFERLGAWRHWSESATVLAAPAHYRGYFKRAAQIWSDVQTEARRYGDVDFQQMALVGLASTRCRLGQINEALEDLEAAFALGNTGDYGTQVWRYGMLALARLRRGDAQEARDMAETAANLIKRSRPAAVHLFDGYTAVAEVYVTLWETSQGQTPTERRTLKRAARRACAGLHAYARVFPIGQPRAWLWQGVYEWLAGKPSKAHKAWDKSLSAAKKLAMPYEEGLAHYEIGRHLPAADPARHDHLTRACEIFTRLEAAHDLKLAQQVLTES